MESNLRALVCNDYTHFKRLNDYLMDSNEFGEVDWMTDDKTLLENINEADYDLYLFEVDRKFRKVYNQIKEKIESGRSRLVAFTDNRLLAWYAKRVMPKDIRPDTLTIYFVGQIL